MKRYKLLLVQASYSCKVDSTVLDVLRHNELSPSHYKVHHFAFKDLTYFSMERLFVALNKMHISILPDPLTVFYSPKQDEQDDSTSSNS